MILLNKSMAPFHLRFVEVVVDFTDLAVLCYLLITLKEKKPWDFSSVIIIIISVDALVEVS